MIMILVGFYDFGVRLEDGEGCKANECGIEREGFGEG
jgi:hypothetical protein